MTNKSTRKARVSFAPEQKLDYAKLMIEDNYSIQQVMGISGAGSTAVGRWKKQYLSELNGPNGKIGHGAVIAQLQD